MIDVNKVEENFNNYVRKFEQTNPKIIIKKFHSIRVKEISEKRRNQVDALWDEVKRFENPHTYYVDMSKKLWELKHKMLEECSL